MNGLSGKRAEWRRLLVAVFEKSMSSVKPANGRVG